METQPEEGAPPDSEVPEDVGSEEEYNPYERREVTHPTTNFETLFHVLKGSLGTGILAMPKAFYNSGYALGTVGTLFIGITCTYCIYILVDTGHQLCKVRRVPSMTYPRTAIEAMLEGPPLFKKCSRFSGGLVNIFLLIYQLGMCCVYTVFIGTNVKQVVDQYQGSHLNVRYYMLMFLVPLIIMNWIRHLKWLAPFMTAANGLTLVGFIITFYYIFADLPSLASRDAFGAVHNYPLFFGTVLFALEAIGVIVPLENNMKTPAAFLGPFGVLNIAMSMIITLYVLFGLFGYIRYGENSMGSVTLNLPEAEILAQFVKIMLSISIFVTHALQMYVAIDILWTQNLLLRFEKSEHKVLFELALRTVMVLLTFGLAVVIPNLELFIALFGALSLSAVGIAIPATIQLSFYWYRVTGRMFWFMLVKNSLLVLFGVTGLIAGTLTSLTEIVESLAK